jgi:inner membrane protein
VDNITHAFVGAALAECALPARATRATRRVFMAAAVVAASAPDVDLAYTWITEAPLGYLLHHRGHSHTPPGLLVLGLILIGVIRLWPAAWRVASVVRARLAVLVAAALASHLLLDAANVYGTHLLYPFTSRWYYGDAVFIFEPWVWLLLGVAVARNASSAAWRRTAWALTVAPPAVLLAVGLVTPAVVTLLTIAGAALSAALAGRGPRARAAVALVGTLVVFAGFSVLSRQAKATTTDALRVTGEGRVVDIAANPNPAVPWCWSVVTVTRITDDAALVVRRGTLSLWPSVRPAETCASHRLMAADGASMPPAAGGQQGITWNREWRVDVGHLRHLATTDCRAAAWLQFGRVPFVEDGQIADLRFDNPIGVNFSAMAIAGEGEVGCPSNLTTWEWPRADVLAVE